MAKFARKILRLKTHHKIINGDSRQMIELPDNSVHLAITSPPYWQLKDYGASNQIGFHDSYENYINNLNLEVLQHDLTDTTYGIDDLPFPPSGQAFHSNLFFVLQKKIFTSISNSA